MTYRQDGFSQAIILVIVAAAIIAAGSFVFIRSKAHAPAMPNRTISSFAECILADNKIYASYPEKCEADGKTFTNPSPKAPVTPEAKDASLSWFLYDSKSFSVRLPDGWQLVQIGNTEDIYGHTATQITQKTGVKATVTAQSEGGWDGPSAFALYLPEQNYDQIVRLGTEQGTIKAASGQLAHKFYYVQEAAEEGPGYQKGDKVYGYYFDADGKYIQISHTIGSVNTVNQHETVESLIKTLTIK